MPILSDRLTLKRMRLRAGLTQQELALAAGINVITISRAERGVQRPHRSNLQRLADVLEVTLSEIEQAIGE